MKYILLLVIYVFVMTLIYGQSPTEIQEIKKIIEECKKSTNATDDDILKVFKSQILDTKPSQCLAACIDKKRGYLSSDNKIDVTASLSKINRLKIYYPDVYKQYEDMITECKAKETTEADECVAAMKFHNCISDKRKAANITDIRASMFSPKAH